MGEVSEQVLPWSSHDACSWRFNGQVPPRAVEQQQGLGPLTMETMLATLIAAIRTISDAAAARTCRSLCEIALQKMHLAYTPLF
jgi:hypothetical protein